MLVLWGGGTASGSTTEKAAAGVTGAGGSVERTDGGSTTVGSTEEAAGGGIGNVLVTSARWDSTVSSLLSIFCTAEDKLSSFWRIS